MKPNRAELLFLTGEALKGILADHQHHIGFKGLKCPQATTEWAVRYGFETWYRFNRRFKQAETAPISFPKRFKHPHTTK